MRNLLQVLRFFEDCRRVLSSATLAPWRAVHLLLCLLLMLALPRQALALVVLQYHHISETTPAATSTSPARFTQHMEWLAQNQYKILSMPELLALLDGGKALPDKAAVITFDDGYTSIYSTAWPVLRHYNWPFTVFVNSQHHDEQNRQYMSWAQLREMAEAGVTIGNHSVSHSHMIRRLSGETESAWVKRSKKEITDAQKRINAELGVQPKVFAYPFGEHNLQLEKLLKRLGYVAFAQHSGPIAPFDSLQALPRFPFGGTFGDAKDFALKVASLPMPLKAIALLDNNDKLLVDPLVADKSVNVSLLLEGDPGFLAKVSCFYSGEPAAGERKEGRLLVTTPKPIPSGRSRFNCTAPHEGRYHWLSKMVIKKNADGTWYQE